ncbi:putative F-box domain-containing protein [Tanacetum coccineum]
MENYLPFDIQVQIMQRILAKSLIQFKYVSKPWNSLIHNSKFIGDCHVIQHTQAHNPLLIRYGDTEDDGKDKCVSIIDDDIFPKHKFFLSIPFVLWNLTIKKSAAIDLPTNDDELDILPDHQNLIGFGVCPKTLDAKLVKITSESPFVSITNIIQVEVYTLSSRVWRILASRDSLVLLKGNNWDMHVWIMKNGDPKSFTRLYTIDMPAENIVSVLGFRKSGEPIIEMKRDKNESEIIVYQPNTYQIRYTGIVGQLGTFFVSSYIETLLLLDLEDNDNVVDYGAFKRQRLE